MIIKKQKKTSAVAKVNKPIKEKKEETTDLFDINNIDFSERQERRRGDRRRGYRRIDDRNLVSRAQEEAQTIKDSAAKEGYKAGIEKAEVEISEMKNALSVFLNSKQEVFDFIAPNILEISVDIAKKIIKKEVEQNPQLILETILEILKNLSKEEPSVRIKVNPSQVDFVKENISEIISLSGTEAKIKIFSDDTIELGSCIMETNNGIVDATINTQLEIIKEAFKGI